ncbi:TlyA family RNA methyltransferase [Clostridium cylindrosporum]|uniref:TlyA family rRNA methyltransferase n=1 Tax=Clostridium cylindrosporum DSM 605 TaxID=1121307 RepID=A0A0J8D5C3_CLOCY|nr:TlyA family RNA methyltransferase [Clostridium cylindrosporum]KMT21355.1 TlyA family rRNA methyltransferase [Clostridium cylindrosporum DSM 605]
MAEAKERIDILLVEKGFFDSREKARKNIMAGLVFVNGNRVDKPGEKIKVASNIEVKGDAIGYVSRGGLKLAKAMKEFNIILDNKVCMDVGASTGGFTDCMLKNGAKKVYAVDVGYGQMAWVLRTDERVRCMERTNIRYVTPEHLDEELDFASIDVSFISLRLVLPVLKTLLSENGEIVALIKPQFEAGREKVGKKGVVRDPAVHEEVILKIMNFAVSIGYKIKGLQFSPVKGPEGNIEYLLYLTKEVSLEESKEVLDSECLAKDIVRLSHESL